MPRIVMSPEERKEAGRLAAKRWRDANKEKHRAAVKRCQNTPEARERHRKRQLGYAANNREQERLRAAEWRKNNPEKARELDRAMYLKNKSAALEYNRNYRLANPDRCGMWARNRQGRKRAGGGSLSKGYVDFLYEQQGGKCLTCPADFRETGYQIDHVIPLAKGGRHCDDNVQLLCPTCNKRKAARSLFDFLTILAAEND